MDASQGEPRARPLEEQPTLFKNAFESGTLFLPILWHGDKPLCALAFFVDPVKKAMLFHMAGRDETADVIPSGWSCMRYCIRRAIEQGFRSYDFLRGNEPYKYSFGSQGHRHQLYVGADQDGPESRRATGHQVRGHRVSAGDANFMRQTNWPKPKPLTAKFSRSIQRTRVRCMCWDSFSRRKDDHWEAAKTYEALAAVVPTSGKVWSRLAGAYQALDRHSEAVSAFRKALELKPGFAQAQDGLGEALIALQLAEKATHALSALHRRPDRIRRALFFVQTQQCNLRDST